MPLHAESADGQRVALPRIFGNAPGAYGAGIEDLLGREPEAPASARLFDRGIARLWRRRRRGRAAPGAFAHVSPPPICCCIRATIPAATFSKAPKTLPLSAALPQLRTPQTSRRFGHARPHRSATPAPAIAGGGAWRGSCGRARDQPTLHRRADAPRPARRCRACRNRRQARRLRSKRARAVASELFDLLHDAYVADRTVCDFLLQENPQAATAIAERLDTMRRHGFWHPRRNDVDAGLRVLRGAGGREATSRASMRGQNLATPMYGPPPQTRGAQAGRRGACPGLSTPMPTGDGLLVRLLPIGTVALDALDALCVAAQAHGNGVIEVTGRGNIQVRGLCSNSAPRFAAAIGALEIAAANGIPVLSNALAELDPEEIVDASALERDLRAALGTRSLGAAVFTKSLGHHRRRRKSRPRRHRRRPAPSRGNE